MSDDKDDDFKKVKEAKGDKTNCCLKPLPESYFKFKENNKKFFYGLVISGIFI